MRSLLHLEGGTCTLMETELQSLWLCDLPEDITPLSINGSHGHPPCILAPSLAAHKCHSRCTPCDPTRALTAEALPVDPRFVDVFLQPPAAPQQRLTVRHSKAQLGLDMQLNVG